MSTMGRNRFNLTPDRQLSPTTYSIPQEEVPAACAVLRSQGWQEIPCVGQLEYARFTGAEVTLIMYVSGFVATIGLQAAVAARGAA